MQLLPRKFSIVLHNKDISYNTVSYVNFSSVAEVCRLIEGLELELITTLGHDYLVFLLIMGSKLRGDRASEIHASMVSLNDCLFCPIVLATLPLLTSGLIIT